jgi:glycosyltransferase involved in cell wall biosynthesis
MTALSPDSGAGSDQPAISVLVPTYNSARYLASTLDSVLAQTDPDFEIVIADDCSSDDSVRIATEYAARDSRIRVVRNQVNLGLHGNLVHLMHLARGPLLKPLMADDLLMPEALARLRAPLENDPAVSLSTSRRIRIDGNGERLPDTDHLHPPVTATSVIDGRLLGNTVLEHGVNLIGEPSTVMFRRADIKPGLAFSVRGVRYGALVDMALWMNLLSIGNCAYDIEPLSAYRQHDDQLGVASGVQIIDRLEWVQMLLDVPTLGFLRDPDQEARALSRRLRDVASQAIDTPDTGIHDLLSAAGSLTARLAELHRQASPVHDPSRTIPAIRDRMGGDWAAIVNQVQAVSAVPAAAAESPRSLSVILATGTEPQSAAAALRAVREQAPAGTEVLALDSGLGPAGNMHLAHLLEPGRLVPLPRGAAEDVWEAGLQATSGDLVLFLSGDVTLQPASLDLLIEQVTRDPHALASPMLVGPLGTGVSSDLSGFESVCLVGRRQSLLGDDPMNLLPVPAAQAATR